ncbi:MAG: SAM-dependent chlorinase/fluorinase [Bacteroidetes bacterium]|nr:SAM-dependent chlorinase/fluorinase [Bacteroidota bacterium]
MPIITLTSDWGLKDHYLASVKGKILSNLPDTQIVDISHQITPFNIEQAAFVVKNCYADFPKGSIHLIGIDTEESEKHSHMVIFHNDHYFIGTDNGVFSMIFEDKPKQIFELSIPQDTDSFTFSTRDRFIKAAVHLAKGKAIKELGNVKEKIKKKILFKPVTEKSLIKGMVIHIDGYENLTTNITKDLFDKVGKGKKFLILLRGDEIRSIRQSYRDVPVGEIVALFDSNAHLEIAINQGNACSLLGFDVNDPIRIEFVE